MKEDLVVCGLHARPGEKIHAYVDACGTDEKKPVTLIHGRYAGKRLVITAGVHGAEYPGIIAASKLAREIDPEQLTGEIVIFHVMNIGGFYGRVAALVPEDGKNLNRVFPGTANGTVTERIADFLTNILSNEVDVYLDLHSGDLHEDLLPHAFYSVFTSPEAREKSMEIAKKLDISCMVHSHSDNGSLFGASLHDVPGLLIERGGNGIWADYDAEAYKRDLYRILYHLAMYYTDYAQKPLPNVPDYHTSIPLYAEADGMWMPRIGPGNFVKEGDLIGYITDAFGNVRQAVAAKEEGLLLCVLSSLSVQKGGFLSYSAVRQEAGHQH